MRYLRGNITVRMHFLGRLALVLLLSSFCECSNNYGDQALSISYESDSGLPTFGTLNGTVTELDTIKPTIELNRTDALLNCSSGFMNIGLKFRQPFFGIVYADFDRNSPCKIVGNGKLEDTIQLPLKGCGTLQRPARVFTNNIVVRFHPGLEIDGDEVITVVCRYPPPIVPPPAVPGLLALPEAPVLATLQPLREFEILLIICAIIFLALLLLGIGCSYYCLKKRNVKVVRRRPASTLGSDITKVSEPVSTFVGLKLPRVAAVDASGSEEATESIKTSFPSDTASLESEEEYTSAYSDKTCILPEGAVAVGRSAPPRPGFDIDLLIKQGERVFTPVMSTASSESEMVLNAQEQYLTTILERTETNTLETLERIRKAQAKAGPPPVHARLNIKNRQMSDMSGTDMDSMSESGTEIYSEQEMELETAHLRNAYLAERERGRQQERDAVVQIHTDERIISDQRDLEETTTRTRITREQQDEYDHGRMRPSIIPQQIRSGAQRMEESRINREYQEEYSDFSQRNIEESTRITREHQYDEFGQEIIRPVIQQRGSVQQSRTSGGLNNFDVIIRIVSHQTDYQADNDDVSSVFTEEERTVIRRVLEEDTELQRRLKHSYTREESVQMLMDNQKIVEIVQPQKWDVLIRILNQPNSFVGERESSHESSQQMVVQRGYRMSDFDGAQSIATSGGQSSFQAHSTADRSGAEITEYHHYRQAETKFEWNTDDKA